MARLPALNVAGLVLHGKLAVGIDLDQLWTDAAVLAVEEAVDDFVAVGAIGGYPSGASAPNQSRLTREGPVTVQAQRLNFFTRAQRVDGRAFQFLRHVISRLELGPAEVQRISVTGGDPARPVQLPLIDDDNEGEAYPEPPPKYRFDVDWTDEAPSKRRRVVVEMNAAVDAVIVEALRRPVERWAALLERSAFTLPYGLPDVLDNVMGQVTLFDAFAIEIEVPVYQSSEVGWDVLLNMLDASSLGIVRVEID